MRAVRNVARDACDTGWGEAAEEGPGGEGGGAGRERLKDLLKDKRQTETKRKQEGFQGKRKEEAVKKRKGTLSDSDHGSGTEVSAWGGKGSGWGKRRHCKKEARTTAKEAGAINGGSNAPGEHLIRRASASTTA